MSKISIAKVAGLAVGATVAFGAFVPMAGAVTVAELQAQINALMAQLAALSGGSTAVSTTFTQDLTVGSTGAQVSALQQVLVSNGYLSMPAGVAMGYFGSLTKSAVMKWQAAVGLPSTGYFGPLSRAKLNGSAGATGTVPGTTVGGVTGSITTPGVEGTLTVSKYAAPASGTKLNEGATKVGVLGIKLEAKTSDIKIERIKLNLGTDTNLYRKIVQKIYVMDGSTVLGSMDVNSDTVVKDGSNYYITLSGLSYVVPKDSSRNLTVAVDAYSTWDSAFDNDSWTITVPTEGVRGLDGAGINQYGPSSSFSNSFTTQAELADQATLTLSTNSNTPQDQSVICNSGTNEDQCDQLELLRADFKAEKDAVKITDLAISIDASGSTASSTVAYLYDGSTLIGSETVDSMHGATSTTFSDIDWTIPAGSTKTLSVRTDIVNVTYSATTFVASTTGTKITAENSNGTVVYPSGTAQGESVIARKAGLEVTLLSKSISKDDGGAFSSATSSLTANFKVRLTAKGEAVEFGDTASTTFALADNDNTLAAGESFVVYRGGSVVHPAVSSSTTMVIGSGVSAASGANSWVLGENNSVDVDLTYVMQAKDSTGSGVTFGAYAVGLERLNWLTLGGGRQASTFMSGDASWRTSTVTLP